MEDIENFLKSANYKEKQLLGKFVDDLAQALRSNVAAENAKNIDDFGVTTESSFATTKQMLQDDLVISFNAESPSPAFDRPCTADVPYRPCTPAVERPLTAPEQRPATATDRPATVPDQRPATAQPTGLPTKPSVLETRKATSARPRDRHALFKEYMQKMSEERKVKEAAQQEETNKEVPDTRSVLENKYRPQSRSSEIRARTAERVQQSRQGSRQPAKFEETLRESDIKTPDDDECDSCLRKKLINSLVYQMTDMELDKLEQIIAGDGLRPVQQGRASSTTRMIIPRDALDHNHTGANFQQVDKKDQGHFVIHEQWVSENMEPTNGQCCTIADLLP